MAYTLILASKSPRRKELLAWADVPFHIKTVSVKENGKSKLPGPLAKEIARKKGLAVYSYFQLDKGFGSKFFPLIVAADTIVEINGKILGKPANKNQAKKMLRLLAGKTHRVYTGVFIVALDCKTKKYREKVFVAKSSVVFDHIDKDLLERYLNSDESLDKAGAYGIQGAALTFISKVSGSYSNVVGFPLSLFMRELKSFLGYKGDLGGKWRQCFVGRLAKT